MNRALTVSLSIAFVTTLFAGCIGDGGDDVSGAIPRVRVAVTEVAGQVDTFLFDGSGSSGRGLKFEWDFDDGETSSEEKVTHTFVYGASVYNVKLTITDAAGIKDVWEGDIQVGDGVNRPPFAFFQHSTRYLAVGEPLTVDAGATTDEEGDPIRYDWDFNFIMTEAEYLAFREAKQDADYDGTVTAGAASVSEGDGGTGETGAALPIVDPNDVTALVDGQKSPGHDHGNEAPPVSLFNGLRSSAEPVFTLEEGFPDPTRFYVKLTALDVKGASSEILSEEVWPVLVVASKTPEYYEGEFEGTFTLGGPATFTDNAQDTEGVYRDQAEYTFEIPNAIIDMYVNVTWSQHPGVSDVPEVGEALANSIDLEVQSPNDKTRIVAGEIDEISLRLTAEEFGAGKWDAWLWGRSGAMIDWTLTYWAQVDLNPFRDLEAPYVEIERPDQ